MGRSNKIYLFEFFFSKFHGANEYVGGHITIVMNIPTDGTHRIISPMKLKISFLSRIASWTLFT